MFIEIRVEKLSVFDIFSVAKLFPNIFALSFGVNVIKSQKLSVKSANFKLLRIMQKKQHILPKGFQNLCALSVYKT